jgi:hypothetical protein
MNNHNNISISRNLFTASCVAAAVLAVAFVVTFIKLQSQPPLGGGEQRTEEAFDSP